MEANRLRHLLLQTVSLSTPSIPIFHSSNRSSCLTPSASDSFRCRSRPDVRKPDWDAADSKFYPYSELYDDDEDEEDVMFGFDVSKKKQRKWWSDDEEDDVDDEFWGFKILKVFGWMVPAILVSMLLGTGPNALFMAVALPLGQTALSLAVDKVWGMAGQTSKPRSRNRTRSKPFRSSSSSNRARKSKQYADFVRSKESGRRSPSSTGFYESAQGNGHRASTSFGGWDELDRMLSEPSRGER